jgi:hypothetical protein
MCCKLGDMMIKKYVLSISLFCIINIMYVHCQDWQQLGGALDMTGTDLGDNAGYSVSMNSAGDMIAVGERGWSSGTGRVRVYTFDGTSWIVTGGDIIGENNGDVAGSSVAISSDGLRVAVGEPGWTGGSYNGRVRVYELNGGSWVQIGSSVIEGASSNNSVGESVAISSDGSRVAVGEPGNVAGRVWIFDFNGSSWTLVGDSIPGDNSGDQFGHSVAISSDGSRVVVGELGSTSNGRVRVYELSGGSWVQVGSDIIGQDGGDELGWSVAINSDGSIIAIGEPGWPNGITDGRVSVYELNGGSWTLIGSPITGSLLSRAGYSVALNASGTRVAIGQKDWEILSGRMLVYEYSDNAWTLIGDEFAMTGDANDEAGISVSMNSEGSRVVMGENQWDEVKGRARAYELSGSTSTPTLTSMNSPTFTWGAVATMPGASFNNSQANTAFISVQTPPNNNPVIISQTFNSENSSF